MALTSNIKDKDWVSVRQAAAKLGSLKLGPTSTPTFLGVTTTTLTITGLTTDSLIYAASGGSLTSLGVASDGQLAIGSTGTTPVLATITPTANQVNIANAAGSITLSTPQDIHDGASNFTVAGLTVNGLVSINKDSANAPLTLSCYHDTEATTALITLRKADGSAASPALVDDNAVLGTINFDGYDGSGWHTGARIEAKIQGTPSDGTDMPTEISIYTTSEASATPLRRVVVMPNGSVGVGTYWGLNPTFTPTKTLEVVDTRENDYVVNIVNLHATNGKGLLIRAGDDANVNALLITDYDTNNLAWVTGDGTLAIVGSPAIGLDMSAGTFSTAAIDVGTGKIEFRDTAIGIYSQADTFLDLYADGGIRIGDSSAGAPTNYTKFTDGTMTQTGTARINWSRIAANGATVTGCTTASNVTDLISIDANTYTCSEVASTANYLVVDFTSVTAFNWVQILANYQGNAVHNLEVQLEITPFDGSAWVTYDSIEHQTATTATFQDHSFFVEDDTPYINSGVVKVRVIHSATESNGHTWTFNIVALHQ